MASAVIHMAIANEINKVLKRNENEILIGSISPDISKFIGQTKIKSHFLDSTESDIPNINKFLLKYKENLNDDFVMGYYIHLYTDYLWFKYFVPELYNKNSVTKLDGTTIKCDNDMLFQFIYSDYTNLNIKIIDEYNISLSIFYNNLPKFNNIITEIPMDKLQVVVDKMGTLIKESKERKESVFDISNVIKFIETSTILILSEIQNNKLVNTKC